MNTKQKLHQLRLNEWSSQFSAPKASGLTVKQWCDQNNLSIHTYNYWKHLLKEELASQVLPDIVPFSLRDLKELYVQFNTRNAGKPMDARIELDKLINHYLHCGNSIFVDFANLLIRNHAYIINSFVMVEKYGAGKIYSSRLSNGPIESLNRKVKDLKRLGRGYRNFEHFRTRFLYATRDTPVINGINDYNPVTYFDMED